MYEYTDVCVGYDNQEIKEDYVLFKKRPTKEELDNLPITNVYYDCNEELDENFKTSKITYLYFGKDFNQPVDNLPSGLIHLAFDRNSNFNQSVINLPSGLTHLKFREDFNQEVNNLPSGLTYLKFGVNSKFNQLIDNLPVSLTHLKFGYWSKINQQLDFLPSSLEELVILNRDYSHDLNNLPVSLKKLSVSCYYKGQIVLPKDCVLIK